MKSKVLWFIKLGVVVGLMIFLAKRGFLSWEATKTAFSRLDLIIPATIIFYINVFLGIWRWQLLLRAQGVQVKFLRAVELSFVGYFFNIALPGAVTGDLVKAIYVGKEAPGLRAQAFGSILFDRIVGVSALVFVSAGALLIGVESFWGTQFFEAIEKMVLIIGAVVILFYAFLFFWGRRYDPILAMGARAKDQKSALGSAVRTYQGIRDFGQKRGVVFQAMLISVLIHLLVVYGVLLFTKALGETQLSPVALFAVVPLGLLVTAIPVLPAGIGTGHAAFTALFKLIGSERGADAFSLFAIFQIVLGGIGGLVYLRFKAKHAQDSPQTTNDLVGVSASPLSSKSVE